MNWVALGTTLKILSIKGTICKHTLTNQCVVPPYMVTPAHFRETWLQGGRGTVSDARACAHETRRKLETQLETS